MAKAQAAQKVEEPKKLQRFVRIVEHPLKPGDTFRGYQAELVWVDGDKVVKRQLLAKPNLFEYAQATGIDYIDPRNESLPDA